MTAAYFTEEVCLIGLCCGDIDADIDGCRKPNLQSPHKPRSSSTQVAQSVWIFIKDMYISNFAQLSTGTKIYKCNRRGTLCLWHNISISAALYE